MEWHGGTRLCDGRKITTGAAGGIELSETNEAMMDSMVFGIIGLLTMSCGVLGLNRAVLFD